MWVNIDRFVCKGGTQSSGQLQAEVSIFPEHGYLATIRTEDPNGTQSLRTDSIIKLTSIVGIL